MIKRINYAATSPQAWEILLKQESYLGQQLKENAKIWELVKLRVSQINQCAYCIDMHSKDALKQGETMQRIYALNAWRDSPFYTETERQALQWAELVTSMQAISDELYQQALEMLGEQLLVDLTVAINAINSWNRIAKVFKPEVGGYEPS